MISAPAIGFEYRPSRWTARLVTAMTGMAAIATALSGLPWAARILLVLASIAGCLNALGRLRLPIRAVGWSRRTGWTVHGLDGGDDAATLASSRVLGEVVLLRLTSPRYGKLTLWLLPDNSDADVRRRLRLRLAAEKSAIEHAL